MTVITARVTRGRVIGVSVRMFVDTKPSTSSKVFAICITLKWKNTTYVTNGSANADSSTFCLSLYWRPLPKTIITTTQAIRGLYFRLAYGFAC